MCQGIVTAKDIAMLALVVSLGLLFGATVAPYLGPSDSNGPMTGVALVLAIGPIVALLCAIVPALWRFLREPFPPFRWF